MTSSIKVYALVNATELLQYLPNLPAYIEPPMITDIRSQFAEDTNCIMCKTNNLIDLSKFQAKIINGHLFITCSDIKILITNGFVPKCIFIPVFKQPRLVKQSYPESISIINPFSKIYNPDKVPNEFHYYSYEEIHKQEEMKKKEEAMKRKEEMRIKEEAMKRKEAKCMQLKSICEDESSILSGLIHMTYMNCIHYYGSDAIHKAPGAIYCDIINNIIDCGKFMNNTISSISTILNQEISSILIIIKLMEDNGSKNYQIIDEIENYRKLMSDCHELSVMWNDIETWINGYHDDFSKTFDELIPKMFEYIEYFQQFALVFNKTDIKIGNEPLSAIGLINQFITKHRK